MRLGQTASVAIVIVASAEDALYVPTAAITTASDGTSTVEVVDVETGETETVTVETGVVGDEGTEITSGLELGDTIVIGIATETTNGTNRRTGEQRGVRAQGRHRPFEFAKAAGPSSSSTAAPQ